jgi:hypothetical protein
MDVAKLTEARFSTVEAAVKEYLSTVVRIRNSSRAGMKKARTEEECLQIPLGTKYTDVLFELEWVPGLKCYMYVCKGEQ